jgi:hypothetical protein
MNFFLQKISPSPSISSQRKTIQENYVRKWIQKFNMLWILICMVIKIHLKFILKIF